MLTLEIVVDRIGDEYSKEQIACVSRALETTSVCLHTHTHTHTRRHTPRASHTRTHTHTHAHTAHTLDTHRVTPPTRTPRPPCVRAQHLSQPLVEWPHGTSDTSSISRQNVSSATNDILRPSCRHSSSPRLTPTLSPFSPRCR
jgi:hypothetical protein